MKSIPEHLLEICSYDGPGYQPLIDYNQWRVAILRSSDDLLPERIKTMQRHDETDEVFVLLAGRCILFIGEGNDTITSISAVELKQCNIYNVKRGVWHSHTLNNDAVVLVVENRETTFQNSPKIPLNDEHRRQIAEMTRELWLL